MTIREQQLQARQCALTNAVNFAATKAQPDFSEGFIIELASKFERYLLGIEEIEPGE